MSASARLVGRSRSAASAPHSPPGRGTSSRLCGQPLPPTWLVRVLGVRQLAQELVVLAAPTRAVLLGAAATDALHAASMVGAALIWPAYRRLR